MVPLPFLYGATSLSVLLILRKYGCLGEHNSTRRVIIASLFNTFYLFQPTVLSTVLSLGGCIDIMGTRYPCLE